MLHPSISRRTAAGILLTLAAWIGPPGHAAQTKPAKTPSTSSLEAHEQQGHDHDPSADQDWRATFAVLDAFVLRTASVNGGTESTTSAGGMAIPALSHQTVQERQRRAAQVQDGLRWLRAIEKRAIEKEDVDSRQDAGPHLDPALVPPSQLRLSSPGVRAEAGRLRALARAVEQATISAELEDRIFRAPHRTEQLARRDGGATLHGTITDGAGRPVFSAEVSAYRRGPSGALEFVALGFTDEDGRFRFSDLAPGDLDLEVRSPGVVDLALGEPPCRALSNRTRSSAPSCRDAGERVSLRAGTTVEVNLRGTTGAAVTGSITDENGDPLVSAYVAIRDELDRQIATGFAHHETGLYRIENLAPDQTVFVVAQKNGKIAEIFDDIPCPEWDCRVQDVGQGILLENGVDATADFDLEPGGTIRISLLDDPSGEPLPNWPASSTSILYADATLACRGSSAGQADGQFLSCQLPEGDYLVVGSSSAAGYVRQVYDGLECVPNCDYDAATPITVRQGQTTAITMSLRRGGSISGSVTDSATGLPLPYGTLAYLYDEGGAYLEGEAIESDGTFQFVGLQGGTYYLRSQNAAGYFEEIWQDVAYSYGVDVTTGQAVSVTFGENTPGIDFELDRGFAIRGTLTERLSGEPLVGASVYVFDSGLNRRTGYVRSDGTWEVNALVAETYRVLTRHGRSEFLEHMWQGIDCPIHGCSIPDATPIELGARGDAEDIDLSVIPPARIVGTVRDENGVPIVGARVWAANHAGRRGAWNEGGRGTSGEGTDADGAFVVTGIEGGQYTVVAEHPDYVRTAYGSTDYCSEWECGVGSGTTVTVAPSSEVSGIDFVLPRGGVVEGRVAAKESGAGLENTILWVYDGDGMPVEGLVSGPDGSFRMAAVPLDGDYTVSATFSPAGYIRTTWRNMPSTFAPNAAPATQTLSGDRITFEGAPRGEVAIETIELALDTIEDSRMITFRNEFLDPEAEGSSGAVGVYTCSIQSCGIGGNPNGTVLQLEATPGPRSVFVGWSGDPACLNGEVVLDDDVTCIATFDLDPDAPPSEIFADGFESGSTVGWGGV